MAKKLVVHGAKLKCSQGLAPSTLAIINAMASASEQKTATIMDFIPMVNIAAFGMCQSTANPQVAAATAAAMGTLTPQPCIPVVTAPWSPGSSISSMNSLALLTDDSTCNCQWAGSISITDSATDVTTE